MRSVWNLDSVEGGFALGIGPPFAVGVLEYGRRFQWS